MTTVIVAPVSVAMFPEGGGHFWVFLQWIRGLQRNGCEVFWLECLEPKYLRQPNDAALRIFFDRQAQIGMNEHVLVYQQTDDGIRFINRESVEAWRIIERADVLLNFKYDTSSEILSRARRTALIDIDPGLLQFWLSNGQLTIGPHDRYFTTGERIGTTVPTCGLDWHQTRPVVDTIAWPFNDGPRRAALTTVTNWFGEWLTDGHEFLLDNSKRIEFTRIIDLPTRTPQPIELAACFGDNEEDEQQKRLLSENGWLLRHSFDVAGDLESYQQYIVGSRGEFSCVKPSCLMFANAWISDRTLCYLASGRPAVVQDTGPSDYLPKAEGLFRFENADEAIDAIDQMNRRYDYHCMAARELAVTHFDAANISAEVLDVVFAARPRQSYGLE